MFRRCRSAGICFTSRSEEHTSELQSHVKLVCRLLLEKKKTRATLRAGLVEGFRQAVARESELQAYQMRSPDFKEGVRAMTERRAPSFEDDAKGGERD